MRARWEGLHAALMQSVRALEADRQFVTARREASALARFTTAAGLLSYLTDRAGDLDEKDAIYTALVRAEQAGATWAAFATSVLWCGLWPGLDAVYRECLQWVADPDELVSALSGALTALVARMNLSRVNRVAATLVRSTRRDVITAWRREWRQATLAASVAPKAPAAELAALAPAPAEDTLLRQWVRTVAGADGELFLDLVIAGELQREAAVQLGISHEALRKRLQRVRERLADSLSHGGDPERVLVDATQVPPPGALS